MFTFAFSKQAYSNHILFYDDFVKTTTQSSSRLRIGEYSNRTRKRTKQQLEYLFVVVIIIIIALGSFDISDENDNNNNNNNVLN